MQFFDDRFQAELETVIKKKTAWNLPMPNVQ